MYFFFIFKTEVRTQVASRTEFIVENCPKITTCSKVQYSIRHLQKIEMSFWGGRDSNAKNINTENTNLRPKKSNKSKLLGKY